MRIVTRKEDQNRSKKREKNGKESLASAFDLTLVCRDGHRLLVYPQRERSKDMLANTPLYKGQVFAASSNERFVQFRDKQHCYMLEVRIP